MMRGTRRSPAQRWGRAHELATCIGLAALLAVTCNLAHAQGRIECGVVASSILRQAVRYCAFLPSSYDAAAASKNPQAKDVRRYPVLYDLHGLGDNEQSLMNTGAWSLIQDLREQHKIGEFLIVTPDGARSFYINSRDGRERYSDFFLQEFMPTIERKYRVRAGRNARGITGNVDGRLWSPALCFRVSATVFLGERP